MHRANDPEVTEAERLRVFAMVGAYQEGDDPAVIESTMRMTALSFAEHPDYRREWRP